jgi:hypothetical protein
MVMKIPAFLLSTQALECLIKIQAPVAMQEGSASRPGNDPTSRSCVAQKGTDASISTRKAISLPCLRPSVESAVAIVESRDKPLPRHGRRAEKVTERGRSTPNADLAIGQAQLPLWSAQQARGHHQRGRLPRHGVVRGKAEIVCKIGRVRSSRARNRG